jgi:SulP family sulfate permease
MGVIQALLPVATGIALISIIETLLAAKIAARAQGGKESNIDPNQLMVGLGVGNAASSMIGGIGGCGLIPNTILNSSTGGKGPLSAISYSLALTVILLLFAPALGAIPMASLAGLMFTVAFNTFEWNETKAMLVHAYEERTKAVQNKQKYLDVVGLLVTMITCFYVDMGVGIISGVVITKGIDILDYFKRK